MINSISFKEKVRLQKYKKARYAIGNVSEKDLSKIIREFEKFEKSPYEKKRTKHEPTDSYVYQARQLAKCMMRSKTLNWHNYGGYMEMTALTLNVYSTDEDESKRIIVHKTLSQNFSENKEKSKQSIFSKTLSQNYSADIDEVCSTEEYKSECIITKPKDAGIEVTLGGKKIKPEI